jgi:hypothetical protein
MPVDEIITRLFIMVDDELRDVKQPNDARLAPSEVVTIGLLFALKGGKFRAFYRWLKANYGALFPRLNERTRLARLLVVYQQYTDRFLANPSFFTVIDTFGIELIHPRREGRSKRQIGRKGLSNGRWIVGIKIAWLINDQGQVVDWAWDDAAEPDNAFNDTAQQYAERTISLADMGFRKKGADLQNIKICEKGIWNERFLIETLYSVVEGIFHSKKLYHRKDDYVTARLGYMAALVNCLLQITDGVLSFKDFVL